MTLFTKTASALEEVEAALAAAPPTPAASAAAGWAATLSDLAPAVAKLKANAAETDPEKRIYAPAMCEKVMALATRFESALSALVPLKARGNDLRGTLGVVGLWR
jgi:hypothetical protein